MRKMRNMKTLTAATLVAAMTLGTAMTAVAADASGDVNVTSDGSYEGGEMKYPALSVTLPTIAKADYDYIADPNGLIAATNDASGDAAKYTDSRFDKDANGIYFLTTAKTADGNTTGKNLYTDKSAAKTVTNENAQDINVTVKLEEATAGDSDIAYGASGTFTGTDKGLYLAVTDGANKTAALSESAAAEVTATVAGNKNNYKPNYDSTDGYGYVKKDAADLEDWNDCAFYLTGALNKDAKWGDSVQFPSIKVTWSYAEATDAAPSVADVTYSIAAGGDLDIPYSLGAGALGKDAVTDVAIEFGGKVYSINGGWNFPTDGAQFFSIEQNKVVISEEWMAYYTAGEYTIYLQYDNDNSLDEGTYAAVKLTVTQ